MNEFTEAIPAAQAPEREPDMWQRITAAFRDAEEEQPETSEIPAAIMADFDVRR